MRVSSSKVNDILKNQISKTLAQVVADIKTPQESHQFLQDFFTQAEFESFSKRLAVAYWLKKGRSYTNIKNNLKVSSATIADVANMMKKKGFELAIKKLEAEEWANQWADKIKKFVGK
ncbi:MAG TPA: Trp family transcriptional regulator [Patescibacteria group bacterium]